MGYIFYNIPFVEYNKILKNQKIKQKVRIETKSLTEKQ